VDVRERTFLREFPTIYEKLKHEGGHRVRLLFIDATDETLIRRFSETRRPHPLAANDSLEAGIRRERQALQPLRDLADAIIDSSPFNVHQLRHYIQDHFAPSDGSQTLVITLLSFGYKHGIPGESDLLFDTRFLQNPFFVDALRGKTGLDREVTEFLVAIPEFGAFRRRIVDMLIFLIPQYLRERRSFLTVAVGCTGGRHRSVAMAEAVAAALRQQRYAVNVLHRDAEKE
jgi:UPF0042 nucleotide-binding protein